jgi:hypothetical protein
MNTHEEGATRPCFRQHLAIYLISMTKKKRSQRRAPEAKVRVVLEALRGDLSLNAICKRHSISLRTLKGWMANYRKIRADAKKRLGANFSRHIA